MPAFSRYNFWNSKRRKNKKDLKMRGKTQTPDWDFESQSWPDLGFEIRLCPDLGYENVGLGFECWIRFWMLD